MTSNTHIGHGRLSRLGALRTMFAAIIGGATATALTPAIASAKSGDDLILGHSGDAKNANTASDATELVYTGKSDEGVIFLVQDGSEFTPHEATYPAAIGGYGGTHKANGIFGYTGNDAGYGVVGWAPGSTGGFFSGSTAPIHLDPSSGPHPVSGTAGDLFVDKHNDLWFCKGGKKWVKLA